MKKPHNEQDETHNEDETNMKEVKIVKEASTEEGVCA